MAARHPLLATALRLGGGVFLLYLGLSALRTAAGPNRPDDAARTVPLPPRAGAGVCRGVRPMLLNPKAWVFWVSLSGVFLGASVSNATAAAAVAGAVVLSLVWHGALAWMFSAARVTRDLARARRALDAALGVVLTALGVKLLASG